MSRLRNSMLLALTLIAAWAAGNDRASAQDNLEQLAPFLDQQTVGVLHIDLRQVDVEAAIEFLTRSIPADAIPPAQKTEAIAKGKEIRSGFIEAGLADIYLVVSLVDLPQSGPFFVFPRGKDARPDRLPELLEMLSIRIDVQELHGASVAGSAETLQRVAQNEGVSRPDLAKALSSAGKSAARLAISPSQDTRRGLRESLPPLPQELGGLSGAELTDSFGWLAAGLNFPPKLSLQITLEAKDPRAAQQLHSIAVSTLDLLAKNEDVLREFPPIKGLAPLLAPKVEGVRLVLKIDEQEGNLSKVVDEVIKPAVASARESARRSQSANNLKQLLLGMHTYHDAVGTFPPQASRKDGKSLLSWRVHLLPYLEQKELYDQFHLDEPWDSDHNKKLIAKMPTLFAAPGLTDEMVHKGLTTYVVPVGPKTVFEGAEGISLARITDGTSNTIAVLEVVPAHAVVWTKPEDWKVDFSKPFEGLFGKPAADNPKPAGFHAALCDGSVRFVSSAIDWEMLRRLLQKDDGEPIGYGF